MISRRMQTGLFIGIARIFRRPIRASRSAAQPRRRFGVPFPADPLIALRCGSRRVPKVTPIGTAAVVSSRGNMVHKGLIVESLLKTIIVFLRFSTTHSLRCPSLLSPIMLGCVDALRHFAEFVYAIKCARSNEEPPSDGPLKGGLWKLNYVNELIFADILSNGRTKRSSPDDTTAHGDRSVCVCVEIDRQRLASADRRRRRANQRRMGA